MNDVIKCVAIDDEPLALDIIETFCRARRLYDSLGFKQVGERFFAGELMDHLQLLSVEDK